MANISVIVPVYNVEKYLNKCIDSILGQTYRDFELILVDDGSPDNCGKICDEYAKKDNRIKVIHKENGGLSSARNAALDWIDANSDSQYLTFIDSDDFVHSQYLELLLAMAEKSGDDIAACYYEFFEEENQCFSNVIDVQNEVKNSRILETTPILDSLSDNRSRVSLVAQCMKLYRRKIFFGLRMPVGLVQEDSLVLPYVLERAKQIVRTDLPLYHWRWTQGSITRSPFNRRDFDNITVSYQWAEYFKNRGNVAQTNYFKREYLQRILYYYYRICNENMALISDFKPYLQKYKKHFLRFFSAKGMCLRERLAYILFLINPNWARKPFMQVYGEFYREEKY